MSDGGFVLEFDVQLDRSGRRHRLLPANSSPAASSPVGSVPRVSRLLALAHHMQGMIDSGEVRLQKELAAGGELTRARITQIMNLLLLAPDIQEEILFLPPTTRGRDPITERTLRRVSSTPVWSKQREIWADICSGGPA